MGQKVSKGNTTELAKKGGVFGAISSFLGIGNEWNSMKSSVNALVSLPNTIATFLKWVAIGGAVLVGIFLIVFIWRFSRGNGPDVVGAAATVASFTPQGRLLTAALH